LRRKALPNDAKTLSFLIPAFRAARLLLPKAQRICSPFFSNAVIAGCSLGLRSGRAARCRIPQRAITAVRAESSSLKYSQVRMQESSAMTHKIFGIAPGRERPALSALAQWRARRVCSSATDRSRVATINLAYSISHEAVSKQIYLTQYGLMAERHWREFRPKMVQELETKGTLMEALFEAQERTIEEMEALTRKLETEQKLTPQQAHDRAWEMIREKYILLSPEENL
jgi:hypothetical protein